MISGLFPVARELCMSEARSPQLEIFFSEDFISEDNPEISQKKAVSEPRQAKMGPKVQSDLG